MLVACGALDGQQEVPEVLAHALDGRGVGLAEQPLLGGGMDGEDLVGVPCFGGASRGSGVAVTDYGHELAFGVFVTPASQEPQRAVRLAQLAEASGLDLITFQDHPYRPAFLDTWTLMSYVAARTQRIRLAGNVLNLPLPNPAVLARSVATGVGLVEPMRTEQAHQRRGIASHVLATGLDRLAAHGCQRLKVSNDIDLYLRAGFRPLRAATAAIYVRSPAG